MIWLHLRRFFLGTFMIMFAVGLICGFYKITEAAANDPWLVLVPVGGLVAYKVGSIFG